MGKIQSRAFLVRAVTGWGQYKGRALNFSIFAIMTKTKTMRDIWDGERRTAKIQKEPAVFSRSRGSFEKHAEEELAKTQKHFLEHLELKKVVMDFFPEYQRYLGEGGFTKI